MDAGVGAWEPPTELGDVHAKALDSADWSGDSLRVEDDAHAQLREVVNAMPEALSRFFAGRCSQRLVHWTRVLTLAEETIPGCDAGPKSPVIVLARLLRERGDYPDQLTTWIKSVSSNRFLPYGSLLDRLQR